MKTRFVSLFGALAGMAFAAEFPMAADDLGTKDSPHLEAGQTLTWSDDVPASVKDRTVAFGDEVMLGYYNADPSATYRIELVMSSNKDPRMASVSVNGATVIKEVAIAPNSEKVVEFNVSPAMVKNGAITVVVKNLKGSPNIAVAAARVFADKDVRLATYLEVHADPSAIQYTPMPVEQGWVRSLDGTWDFAAKAPDAFPKTQPGSWGKIAVPGQWRNQGHDIAPEQTVAYQRSFEIPADWSGRRVKLRFDAVFSDCSVFINGTPAGSHVGGFTPFELDVTDAVKPGANTLSLKVKSWSLADKLASASKYACHTLGGISRSVTLFSVPQNHLKEIIIRTDFDEAFVDAKLQLSLNIAGADGAAEITLLSPEGQQVVAQTKSLQSGVNAFGFAITKPLHWTQETPNLYTLAVKVNGVTTRHPVGFREIAVEGTRLLVNGRPVKLRGVNRHEAHPLRGRSLPEGMWEKDLQLFLGANCNLIRTCHYPPALHLGVAADKNGMWLEIEGPFCWENEPNNPDHRALTIRQLTEMVKAWRNHPSVLFWSVANESRWGANFAIGSEMIRQLDPTRPQTFNWMTAGKIETVEAAHCNIANVHYPSFNGEKLARGYRERPTYFGEYAHLNAYNRRELMTDPGLRNRWGQPLAEMWETMWSEPSVLGGSIWSGIDDTFFLDEKLTVGYGAWGPVDPWRREKPEWWNMKKIYSPVHLTGQPAIDNASIIIDAENRNDFLNFNQLVFTWAHDGKTGAVSPDIAARAKGKITIAPPGGISTGEPVDLTVTTPGGREIDRFSFATAAPAPAKITAAAPQLASSATLHAVKQGGVIYYVDRKSGAFSWKTGSTTVSAGVPQLVITPRNAEGNSQMTGETQNFQPFIATAKGLRIHDITAAEEKGVVTIIIPCTFQEAEGNFSFTFAENQTVRLGYDFTLKSKLDARQTGVAFDLPASFDEIAWTRTGQWTTYPADHIGRLSGTAPLHYDDGKDAIEIGPREQPSSSWSHDNTPYGSNDFRSTKENIRRTALHSPEGSFTLLADEEGTHAQAILLEGKVRFSMLHYSNAGNERFLQRLARRHYRSWNPGDKLTGTLRFQAAAR